MLRALVTMLCSLWIAVASAQDLQIIELRYRLADQVLPSLQPLVEPGGVLTGMDSTLFVRTSPDNFAQIRQAVALLDRARPMAINFYSCFITPSL